MKAIKFENGKTYGAWQHDFSRTIEKRTECYVWINGCKRLVRETFMDDLDGNKEAIEYVEINGRKFFACCDWAWIQQ